jgi:putative glutamine amidotransferase
MMAKQARPFIGINADFISANKRSVAHLKLDSGYADMVLGAGGIPVVIPPLNKETEFNALLDRLDGIILSGGLDMDPRRQQQPMHAAVMPMSERREENDKILLRCLLERQTPLLAVGVGMQQLNWVCGGSLYLHLPEDLPKAMPHFDPTGSAHRHLVLLEPNTRLEEIYGGVEIRVNSSHHQAIRQVGSRLRVSALAPDGVIEAVEAIDPNWFCVGVQWHPESDTASALDMQLVECFVQASVRQSQPAALAA